MSRRTLTLLLAGVLALGMTLVLAVAPVPYVALAPGPTYNTLGVDGAGKPVITIVGHQTYPDSGHLNMTTISVVNRLTVFQAIRGWFRSDLAVVPRDVIYPPNVSSAQVQQQDQAAMLDSQSSATTAALRQLGIPGTTQVFVDSVQKGAPAAGLLQPGDQLVRVDGIAVTGASQLRMLIGRHHPGQPVRIGYLRSGKPAEVTITTAASPTSAGIVRPIIGVLTREQTNFPIKVTISLNDVGGPSAGLMFALGIYDKLTPGSLTDGRFIAGTGTISNDGTVGPIGGIQEKLIGARRKGAQVFLVPAGDCAEALSSPPVGLKLIKVSSLKGALTELSNLESGAATTPCSK